MKESPAGGDEDGEADLLAAFARQSLGPAAATKPEATTKGAYEQDRALLGAAAVLGGQVPAPGQHRVLLLLACMMTSISSRFLTCFLAGAGKGKAKAAAAKAAGESFMAVLSLFIQRCVVECM